jgi:hypothetical protein
MKVNQKIIDLIKTEDLDNIKIAFELSEVANCKYITDFKRKYCNRKVKTSRDDFYYKMQSLFLKVSDLEIWDDLLIDRLMDYLEITTYKTDYCSTNIYNNHRFSSNTDIRISTGHTITEFAIRRYKDRFEFLVHL